MAQAQASLRRPHTPHRRINEPAHCGQMQTGHHQHMGQPCAPERVLHLIRQKAHGRLPSLPRLLPHKAVPELCAAPCSTPPAPVSPEPKSAPLSPCGKKPSRYSPARKMPSA